MNICIECGNEKSRKGIYCKVCSYKHRTRPSGLTYVKHKDNPTSFKKGHVPWSTGTKGVLKSWNKGNKGMKPWMNISGLKLGWGWTKGIYGENNPCWKGDNVGYCQLHNWVKHELGKPMKCDFCGDETKSKYEWANKSGKYKRDVTDWLRLCKKCHNRYDNITTKAWITRKKNKNV